MRRCLSQQGYRVTGGVPGPGAADAPNYQILVAGSTGSAYVAFHKTLARAKRFERRIRTNARRFDGASFERSGTTTTVWVSLSEPAARGRIRQCIR